VTQIALLRGVNVGGKNRLKMAELRQALGAAGFTGVRSYIQSGNLLFDPREDAEDAVAAVLQSFGLDVPLIVRSAAWLRAAREAVPFPTDGVDPRFVSIGACLARPSAAAVAAMDPERGGHDRWAVEGDVVYLSTPKGMARTKLTSAWLDRSLQTVVTVRNLRTVDKLLALAGA
jgi:uncharacterized protein (DUF1697 family)